MTTAASKPLDVLLVSNLWPPHFIGGYELGASEIAARLERRGHRVTVLTSTYGVPGPQVDGRVHRLLPLQLEWTYLAPRDLVARTLAAARDLHRARRFLRDACFDVVYLFSPLGLPAPFVQSLCDTGRPLVAYVSDNWPAQWPYSDRLFGIWMEPRPTLTTARKIALVLLRRWARRLGVLARLPVGLPIRHAQFVSRYIRSISVGQMPSLATQDVIPWGIDVARFPFRERRSEELFNWVYVGQVEEHKGVHTAVDAVQLLRSQGQPVSLTIFGKGGTAFESRLRARVDAEGLAPWVRFAGPRPRERLWAEAYDPAGVYVFPTMWEEPFSIGLLEAFAAGLPVLSTLTGGTGELVRHGQTATVFSVGSAQHLAAQWYSLVRHPEETAAMARRAREIVATHLDMERMVDRIEDHLVAVTEGRGSGLAEYFVADRHPWEGDDVRADLPTRAIEPQDDDGSWLAALWADLSLDPGTRDAVPETDSAPDQVFPITFPPSEVLERYGHLLRGRILNAGAGTVAVPTDGVEVRIDLQLHNRPHVAADLHRLPFRDGTFDTAFSIAVLEHCRRPWVAMRELRRVLRPGGHLLLSLPFMQPAHANPSDYFRFTAEGMQELALDAGFAVVASGAEHGVQQTLAWVLWEVVRHHPRHRYLSSDIRVHRWFDTFSRRAGRLRTPTLASGFYVVARREE